MLSWWKLVEYKAHPPALKYCTTGNVNEQVMLTNLTSGMGSLLFLPRLHLYPVLLNKQHHHEWTTTSIPTVHSVSPHC